MNYADARSRIQSGDVLAWSHRGWTSWYDIKIQLVRLVTRSEYSHVGIAWAFGGRVFVIESVTPVIRIMPLSNLLPCYWINTGASWGTDAEEFALSLVGKGEYSQWEAIMAFFGKNSKLNDRWQCAEFVKAVLARCRVFLRGKDTPSDMVQDALVKGANLNFLDNYHDIY